MTIDNIDRLIEHTDHPVIERYLIAFVGYPDDLESASRDDILHKTLTLDIDLNIRLRRISTEFFDEEGDLIPTPDDWKAQELLGFESTYPCVTLEQIIADIDDLRTHPKSEHLWPWFHTLPLRLVWLFPINAPRRSLYCKGCHDRNW